MKVFFALFVLFVASTMFGQGVDDVHMQDSDYGLSEDQIEAAVEPECKCTGAFNRKTLWYMSPSEHAFRIAATEISTADCLEALRFPPCANACAAVE